MQIIPGQKKYILFSAAGVFTLVIFLLFAKESGLFRASLLSDTDTVYNNPLEESYKPAVPSYSVDMDSLDTSSYQKEFTQTTLGSTVNIGAHETASGIMLSADAAGIKNLRISFANTDPLSPSVSDKIASVKKLFLQQFKSVFPAFSIDSTSRFENTLATMTVEDFLKTTASGTLFTSTPGNISIALNMTYAYDSSNDTVEHMTGPLVQTAGSGTLIVNDVSTNLSKTKNIPLIAERNKDTVMKVKKVVEEELIKRGSSASEALEKTNLLLANNIFFELGYKVSTPEGGYLDPVSYGKVLAASLLKMKEIVPDVQVSIDVPATYAVTRENIEDGEWWNWGNKKNLQDLFQTISSDSSYSSIKNNIKGLSLTLPGYSHWKESLRAVRSIADANGFSTIKLFINGTDRSKISSDTWESALLEMKSLLELSARKDVANIHALSMFSDLTGINVNGYWLGESTKARDLYLATLQKETIRTLPLGAAVSFFQDIFTSTENFSLRLLRSTEVFTEFFGVSADGKKKGVVLNMEDQPKTYTLKNTDKLSITEVRNMTATGSLIEEFHAEETSNTKAKAPFIGGINGHPTNQESYKQDPVRGTTYGVPLAEQLDYIKDMGLTSYRVDVDKPGSNFDEIVSEAKKRNIFILPVIFPPVNLDAESDLAKIEKISYDYALDFASRYKNDIPVWELHNEMDNYTQLRKGDIVNGEPWPYEAWMINGDTKEQHDAGRSAKVGAMMKGLSNGVHAADPKLKTTINGGWLHFGYLERMAEAGVHFDIVSWHWYSNMGDITKAAGTVNVITELAKFGKDIWITEGNKHAGDMGGTAFEQAQYVKDVLLQMKNIPQVKAYYFYELLDEPYFGDLNPESHYGFYQMKKGELGTWIVEKAKPAVAAAKDAMRKIREKELLEKPIFTQGTTARDELTRRYTASLRSEVFPAVTNYTALPNSNKTIQLTIPPKSIVYVTESLSNNNPEKLLFESADQIKSINSAYLPRVIKEPQSTAGVNENTNSLVTGNLNSNMQINTNVTAANTNQNMINVNQNTLRTNQNTAAQDNVYRGVGRTGLGTINFNQNLKSSAPVNTSVRFKDTAGHFAAKEIEYLAQREIIQGRSPQNFVPQGNLNRAESVKLVVKAFYPSADAQKFLQQFKGLHSSYTYVYFPDVLMNTWYGGFVGIAKESRIIKGTVQGLFEPARNITRAEFIKMVLESKKIDIKKESTEFSKTNAGWYNDVSNASWYRDYVYSAAQKGLIDKRANFEPNKPITRGEAAKILYNAL